MSPKHPPGTRRAPGGDEADHGAPGIGDALPGVPSWYGAAADMTDRLHGAGALHDRRLYGVFTVVPRHLLLPAELHGELEGPDSGPDGELAAAYGVLTREQMPDGRVRERGRDPDPAALAWMLGLLGRRDRPHRVLQIGIGHGYPTALLCADHGDGQVVVVEPDPDLAHATGAVLADLGWRPRICAPHELGDPDRSGLFDGVLIVAESPPAVHDLDDGTRWSRYLMPGGRLVAGPGYQDDGGRWVRLAEHGPHGQVHSRWVDDPHPLSLPERFALAHLRAHPQLADRVRATHVSGPGGHCRGCETRHGVPGRAPCQARLLADAAHAATVTLAPLLTSPAPAAEPPGPPHN